MVNVIQICIQLAHTHIPLLCVQWKTPDDGQRNCPKHEEFYSKNKVEKFLNLVGFIISKHGYITNTQLTKIKWQHTEKVIIINQIKKVELIIL